MQFSTFAEPGQNPRRRPQRAGRRSAASDPARPLLLIDVDGVISLFGFEPAAPPSGRYQLVDGILHFISATAGGHLRSLAGAYDLVWCSGWEERANDILPRALDLSGPLPYLSFAGVVKVPAAHWKLDAIDAYAGAARPLAWIDDAHDAHCAAWAAARCGPTLLVGTEPRVGLEGAHIAQLLAWAGR